MKSYVKHFSEHLKERVENPLFPAFVISWCVLNYKIVIHLVFGLDADKKIERIQAFWADGWLCGYLKGVVVPLCLAIAYVFIYPCIHRFIINFLEKHKVEANKQIFEINEENPRTTKELNELHEKHMRKINELREEIDSLEERNQKLTEENTKLGDELNKHRAQF